MKKLKFFKCKVCGNVVVKLVDKNVPVVCCGEVMDEILPNTTEAATEKHLPVVNVKNGVINVRVGEVMHPMEDAHYINFCVIETQDNYVIFSLNPGQTPEVSYNLNNQKPIAVYEYCNLHGLWKTEL